MSSRPAGSVDPSLIRQAEDIRLKLAAAQAKRRRDRAVRTALRLAPIALAGAAAAVVALGSRSAS